MRSDQNFFEHSTPNADVVRWGQPLTLVGARGRKIGHKKHEKSQKRKRLDTRSVPTPERSFERASTASPRHVYRT
jgi:hypothetical protein